GASRGMSASKTEQVYRAILARIQEGFWKQGEQILSERQLSELLSVSRVTVRNALSQLVGEGVLEYREGRLGTFVAKQAEEEKVSETNFIGIALDNYTPAFASCLLEGIHDALWEQGYHTLYCNTHFSDGIVLDKISSFIKKGVKGLIFSPLISDDEVTTNAKVFSLVEHSGLPLVQLDRCIEGFPFGKAQCNNTEAMYQMAIRLFDTGVQRPLLLTGITTSSTQERISGIEKAASERGIPLVYQNIDEIAFYDHERYISLYPEVTEFSGFDAIIGITQVLSKVALYLKKTHHLHCLTAGVSASSIEVSNDYSIIQPLYHIAYSAARLLLQLIDKPKTPITTILIDAEPWP
ncbi:MAG: GntR family transcriptional regulator, partial [Sphaerochaetaceae bacterium]